MKSVKNTIVVILLLIILLILVFVRSSNPNLFKENATGAIEKIQEGNETSVDRLKTLTAPYLVLNLDHENLPDSISGNKIIAIPFENLLDDVNRKILSEVEGDLILYSADPAKSAKAWILLNQLEFKNVSILSFDKNQEELKYKFQPDTTAGLEQNSL